MNQYGFETFAKRGGITDADSTAAFGRGNGKGGDAEEARQYYKKLDDNSLKKRSPEEISFNALYDNGGRNDRQQQQHQNQQQQQQQQHHQHHQQQQQQQIASRQTVQNSSTQQDDVGTRHWSKLGAYRSQDEGARAQQPHSSDLLMSKEVSPSRVKLEEREVLRRLKTLEQKLASQEEQGQRVNDLEDKVAKISQKFSRLDKYTEVLESSNKVIDNLKLNIEAKLMVFEDRLSLLQSKIDSKISDVKAELNEKIKSNDVSFKSDSNNNAILGSNNALEKVRSSRDKSLQRDDLFGEINNLYKLVRKSLSSQKEMFEELSQLKRIMPQSAAPPMSSPSSSATGQAAGGSAVTTKTTAAAATTTTDGLRTPSSHEIRNQHQQHFGALKNSRVESNYEDSASAKPSLRHSRAVIEKSESRNNILADAVNAYASPKAHVLQRNETVLMSHNTALPEGAGPNNATLDRLRSQTINEEKALQREEQRKYSRQIDRAPMAQVDQNQANSRHTAYDRENSSKSTKSSSYFQAQKTTKTESEEELATRTELEKRKMQIDEEINRRVREDRERRQLHLHEKENTYTQAPGRLLYKEKQQSDDTTGSMTQHSKSRSRDQLHVSSKLSPSVSASNSVKSPEHNKYYVQTNRITLK